MTSYAGRLGMWLAHEQWKLEQASYDIPARRASPRQCAELAGVLQRLSDELRDYAAGLAFSGGRPPGAGSIDPDELGGRGEAE
ncbi:hypothetical protein [Actinopolyspora xinjiangensis]|uniref:hypothetical protein n=1 Tax=Actinopolyspora xinjiangensis TaxID=405564 RepID=UPI000B88F631|nr:hypothetical protein [Actinopolyspora xinjiangensis]